MQKTCTWHQFTRIRGEFILVSIKILVRLNSGQRCYQIDISAACRLRWRKRVNKTLWIRLLLGFATLPSEAHNHKPGKKYFFRLSGL